MEFGRKPGLTDSRELRVRKSRLERNRSQGREAVDNLRAKVSEGKKTGTLTLTWKVSILTSNL